MPIHRKNSPDFGEELDLEGDNVFLKLKMQAEFGAEIIQCAEKVSPAVENQFLRAVYAIEKARSERPGLITVYEKIGKPACKPPEILSPVELELELQKIIDLLFRNQIIVESAQQVESRIMYPFIINELFSVEIEDLNIPGYFCHFCYEEFHPDHREDLKRTSRDMIQALLNKTVYPDNCEIGPTLRLHDGRVLTKAAFFGRLQEVWKDFQRMKLERLQMGEVVLKDNKACVHCELCFEVEFITGKKMSIKGRAFLGYAYLEARGWVLCGLDLPGFVL